jgi:hypothetical protein
MSLREIPESRWTEFLEELSRSHRAWLATVDHVGPEAPHIGAGERALRSVAPEQSAGRILSIEIRFQKDAGARDAVRILSPRRVSVDETTEGTARGLEIVDVKGGCTRIRFRAAPLPEMLDGVAPGVLSS